MRPRPVLSVVVGKRAIAVSYDGKNFLLRQPFCFHCQKQRTVTGSSSVLWNDSAVCSSATGNNSKLKKCAACKIAYYCSKECQMADWKKHSNSFCKAIKTQRKKVESSHGALFNEKEVIEGTEANNYPLFNIYLKSRMDLAVMHLFDQASHFHGKWIWDEILSILQEVLRMSHNYTGHDYGIKAKFAMFLLNVDDRDEDAYAFLHYRMRVEGEAIAAGDDQLIDRLDAGSKEGDWIYPPRPKSVNRKEFFLWDVLGDVKSLYDDPARQMGHYYLMALWILKKKAASTIACRETTFYEFLRILSDHAKDSDVSSSKIPILMIQDEVLLNQIGAFLVGDRSDTQRQMDVLNRQLDQIADLLDEGIPSLLPAFLSNDPLEHLEKMAGAPTHLWTYIDEDDFFGRPQEAYMIVMDCLYSMGSLPNIQGWLMQRYS